jgi:lysophospholipase L1-like esterase
MSNLSGQRHGTAMATVAIALTGALGATWAAHASAASAPAPATAKAPASATATAAATATATATSPAARPQVRQPYAGGPTTELNQWLAAGERASAGLALEHPAVLFIGDSITEWWLRDGRATWTRTFAPLGAVNDGVVGDTTSNVLARIDAGQLPHTSPRVVVIMIGTNNIPLGQSPTQIAEGVQAVVDAVHSRLPASHIVLLSVLPRDRVGSMARHDAAALDALLVHTDGVRFVNLWPALVDRTGQFRPGTMRPDLLHPDAGGYEAMSGPILAAIRAA